MKKDKQYREAEEFLDHVIEFISDCGDSSNEELDAELKKCGVPIENLIKSVQQLVGGSLEESRLAWQAEAEQKRKKNLKKFSEKVVDLTRLSKGKLIERFREIAYADNDFSFAYRNLRIEDMSEAELRDILHQYEQLEDKEKA